jgi:hypothetical protein
MDKRDVGKKVNNFFFFVIYLLSYGRARRPSSDALTTVEILQNSSITGMTKVIQAGIIEFRPRKEIERFGLKKR